MRTAPARIAAPFLFSLTLYLCTNLFAQSSGFTYQGRLDSSGTAFSGVAEFQPTLWDGMSSGSQVAANIPATVIVTVTNGLFVLPLDFGSAPFSAGADRWLQLQVRTSIGTFTTVTPRQKVSPTPYAMFSANAATATLATSAGSVAATNITGTLALAQLPGVVVTNSQTGVNLAGNFTGNGGTLSNLNVNSLVLNTTNVSVTSWGGNLFGQRNLPAGLEDAIAIAVGGAHSLAVRSNRTVVAWGAGLTNISGSGSENGQSLVPAGLNNVSTVAAGYLHSVALKLDGTVVAWGWNENGQTNVPGGLNNVTAISGGIYHTLARKSDGTVVGWGTNSHGQLTLPGALTSIADVGAGLIHSVALRSNGTVIAWGDNTYGQTNVPPSLSSVIAIAAGGVHTVALKADGTVAAWGAGLTNAGAGTDLGQSIVPTGLSNVVAVAAGYLHSLALKSDGTVVGWGDNAQGQTNTARLNNIVALALGSGSVHGLALRKRSSAPVAWLDSDNTFNGNIQVNGALRVQGALTFEGDLRMNDGNLWLRSGSDERNGLGWYGDSKAFGGFFAPAPDGPVLFGAGGGALGSYGTNGQKIAVSWDAAQNVGIGAVPTTGVRLSLGSDLGEKKIVLANTDNGDMGFGATSGQFRFFLPFFGGRYSFLSSSFGTELFTINQSGNVGVGTITPTGKLDVRGEVRFGFSGQYYPAATTESLRIVRGVLNAAGGIITGTGFTAAHPSTGVYTITFSPSFSGLPTMTVSADSQGGIPRTAMTDGATGGTAGIRVMTVGSAPANTDAPVHFIAIGPR